MDRTIEACHQGAVARRVEAQGDSAVVAFIPDDFMMSSLEIPGD
jgi:hypothetical protein